MIFRIGLTKWHYQDSPTDEAPMPYTAAQKQDSIIIHLKGNNEIIYRVRWQWIIMLGIEMNSTDSLAYNYFIPSQNLKTFIRYVSYIY